MRKSDLLSAFENLPYFTIEGYKQLVEESTTAARYVPTTLYRWMKTGKIIQIKKGIYMASKFYELHRGEADFAPAVCAIIRPQSYVSLEYVLQREGVLTEVTYPVTAVSMKNTWVIENDLGTFVYRHIKPDLYYGYQMREFYGIPFAQASRAKALFDYLYLRPGPRAPLDEGYDLAEDLRLNLDEFLPQEREEFGSYVIESHLTKMMHIFENLKGTIWQP